MALPGLHLRPGTLEPPLDGLGLGTLAAPELDTFFRHAERTDQESTWFGHLPFAHWLIRALRPRLLVELGTDSGVSYTALCQAVQLEGLPTRCYAVDTWEGARHSEQVFVDLVAYNDSRFAAFSHIMRATFEEACGAFSDASIDLLHFNDLPTYAVAKANFDRWRPKLSERGVVLVHSTNDRPNNIGVRRAWDEISAKWPAFEFSHAGGLGVLCVGAEVPNPLKVLCSLPDSVAEVIRSRLARLGERWELESTVTRLARAMATHDVQIADLNVKLRIAEAAHAEVEDFATIRSELTARVAEARRSAVALRRAAVQRDVANETAASALRGEIKRLREQLANDSARLQELTSQVAEAVQARDMVLNSTAWKLTRPVRRLAASLPPSVRWHGRRALKVAWWAATPWKLPQRLPASRERGSLLATAAGLVDVAAATTKDQ